MEHTFTTINHQYLHIKHVLDTIASTEIQDKYNVQLGLIKQSIDKLDSDFHTLIDVLFKISNFK